MKRRTFLHMVHRLGLGLAVSRVVPVSASTSDTTCLLFSAFSPHPRGVPLKTPQGQPMKAREPSVMYDNGTFKVWYTWYDESARQLGIAYAESQDGMVWEPLMDKRHQRALVLRSTPGSWADRVENVSVLKKSDGTYLAWFLASPGTDQQGQVYKGPGRRKVIGLATSRDGMQWERHPQPVLMPDTPWEEPYLRTVVEQKSRKLVSDGGVQAPSVVWNPDLQRFEMLYEGTTMLGGAKWSQQIGYAASSDGMQWHKHPDNPIFRPWPGEAWNSGAVGYPHLSREPGAYRLFYASGGLAVSIGLAYSTDAIYWQDNPTHSPAIASTLLGNRDLLQRLKQKQEVKLPPDTVVYGAPSLLRRPDGSVHLVDGHFWLYYMRSKPGSISPSGEFHMGLHIAPCRR
jgi:hypothetical protein